jgi:gas vesicle protein
MSSGDQAAMAACSGTNTVWCGAANAIDESVDWITDTADDAYKSVSNAAKDTGDAITKTGKDAYKSTKKALKKTFG